MTYFLDKPDLLDKIIQTFSEALVLVDEEGVVTWSNQRAEEVFGYSGGKLVGFNLHEMLPGLSQELSILKKKENGKSYYGITSTKKKISLYIKTRPINIEGQFYSLLSMTHLTGKSKIEKDFKSIIDGIQDYAIVTLDEKGNVASWNLGAERMKGYKESEILGRHFSIFYPPEDIVAGKPEREIELAKEVHRVEDEGWRIKKNGSKFWANIIITPIYEEDGTLKGFLKVIRDLTERMAMEERFRLIVESAPIAMIMVDNAGGIVLSNVQAEILFGYTKEEFCENTIEVLVPERYRMDHPQKRLKFFKSPQARSMGAGRDLTGLRKDGSEVPIEIGLSPIETSEGLFVLASIVDISERKKNEGLLAARKAALKASEMKSQFLANMSHEIRTPMNGITGLVDLLLESGLNHEQGECADSIKRSAESLLTVINDILDFSKVEAGKMELSSSSFSLSSLIKDTVKLFQGRASEKKLNLKSDLPEREYYLKGDPHRIRQVLSNLINNAIKFTGQGCVSVSLVIEDETNLNCSFKVIVSDTGIGISQESHDDLFKVFSQVDESATRKFGGTGLGLSISKQLIELMGGEIGVDSKLGTGSQFWIKLKLEKTNERNFDREFRDQSDLLDRKINYQDKRILIAEDNDINQMVIKKLMIKIGIPYEIVSNGLQALDALKNNTYDVVFMDCQMPELDGYEVTRKVRSSNFKMKDVPIIAMTANAIVGDKEKCLEAGMNDYITKPFDFSKVQQILNFWLTEGENK